MGKQMTKALRVITGLLLAALLLLASGPGFRSRRQFDEHYQKHGAEFGRISQQEYLERAQELRDAPAGGPILEAVTPEGIVSRFDRRTGSFRRLQPRPDHPNFFHPQRWRALFPRQAQKRGAD